VFQLKRGAQLDPREPAFQFKHEAQPEHAFQLKRGAQLSLCSNSNEELNQSRIPTQTRTSNKPASQLKREPASPAFQQQNRTRGGNVSVITTPLLSQLIPT